MEKRTIYSNGLILLNQHRYILAGDHTINGDVLLVNTTLIVYGDLTINGNLISLTDGNDGNLIVTGYLEICNSKQISLAGDINAGQLKIFSLASFTIHVCGDIYVEGFSTINNNLKCNNFTVKGNSHSYSIDCLNCSICGDNDSNSIIAVNSIRILGSNDSETLSGIDIFISNECELNDNPLTAKTAHTGPISNCSSLNVGN